MRLHKNASSEWERSPASLFPSFAAFPFDATFLPPSKAQSRTENSPACYSLFRHPTRLKLNALSSFHIAKDKTVEKTSTQTQRWFLQSGFSLLEMHLSLQPQRWQPHYQANSINHYSSQQSWQAMGSMGGEKGSWIYRNRHFRKETNELFEQLFRLILISNPVPYMTTDQKLNLLLGVPQAVHSGTEGGKTFRSQVY